MTASLTHARLGKVLLALFDSDDASKLDESPGEA